MSFEPDVEGLIGDKTGENENAQHTYIILDTKRSTVNLVSPAQLSV